MNIIEKKITVEELVKNYSDNKQGGVFGYDGKLTIRPAFQREFVYNDKQREAVISTILQSFPLNIMYWSKTGTNTYEILDGQQRTISICQYVVTEEFPIEIKKNEYFYYRNLSTELKDKIKNYELTIYVCDGTEDEKLEWFKIINIAGVVLTNQELLNATYTGTWLTDAKNKFSKRDCCGVQEASGYMKGNSIRQDYLEKALSWIADRDNLKFGQMYMAIHQHDSDANDLWQYFYCVINWAKMLFPNKIKGITDVQEWGILYNKYHNRSYNTNILKDEINKLLMDDDVTKKSGIIPYLLSDRTKYDEKFLSIRSFSESQKMSKYEEQKHMCPYCIKNGNMKQYTLSEMQGDHIIPWSQGGKTTYDNLQMLCQKCNNDKSNH